MKHKYDLIVCTCLNPNHQLILTDYGITNELWLSLRHSPKPTLFQRIKQAFNYIKGKDLEFAEMKLEKEEAKQLKQRLEKFLNE